MNRQTVVQYLTRNVEGIASKCINRAPLMEFVAEATKVIQGGCEWFDFGEVSFERTILGASSDAGPLVKAGFYVHPYTRYVFSARVTIDDLAADFVLVVFPFRDRVVVQPMTFNAENMSIMPPIAFEYSDRESPFAYVRCASVPDNKTAEAGQCISKLMLGLWMILNTRGVVVERIEPDDKLQKSRAKHGKPPLLAVTRVGAAQYADAQQTTLDIEAGRTHASPRPHLRRAHLLRRAGRPTIMRRGCIVGVSADSPLATSPRDHYQVTGATA